ncbi:MAG: hypothetical protein KDE31_21760, partial [Caldilineaceae bacterium]|nr:hypothetical protein [Caldilineaceae bacterium]
MFDQQDRTYETQVETTQPADKALSRRSFLSSAAIAGVGTMAALTPLATQANALRADDDDDMDPGKPLPRGDIAILKFLAAAELVEDDLWQQYCELAVNNAGFHAALARIDPSLVRYICDA